MYYEKVKTSRSGGRSTICCYMLLIELYMAFQIVPLLMTLS